jgi:hypothetical protein
MRCGQWLKSLQINNTQAQRPGKRMQPIQGCRLALEHVHKETTAGEHPMPGDDQGDAAQVAADDVVLLTGEELEQIPRNSAFFNGAEVWVTYDLSFERFQICPNLGNELIGTGHGQTIPRATGSSMP